MSQETEEKKLVVGPVDEDAYEQTRQEGLEDAAASDPEKIKSLISEDDADVPEVVGDASGTRNRRINVMPTVESESAHGVTMPANMDLTGVMTADPKYYYRDKAVSDWNEVPEARGTKLSQPATGPAVLAEESKPARTYVPVENTRPVQTEKKANDTSIEEQIKSLPKEEQAEAWANYLSMGGNEAYQRYVDAMKKVETQEEASARERKERRNQWATQLANMIGALGNLAVAGSNGAYGRSVPVADVVEKQNAGYEKAREQREKYIKDAYEAGKNYSTIKNTIISNGYKNARERAKFNQQMALKVAEAQSKAADREMRTQAYLNSMESQNESRRVMDEIRKGEYGLKAPLYAARTQAAYAQATRALKAAAQSSGGSISDKTHTALTLDSGETMYVNKTKLGPVNLGKLWSKIPDVARIKAMQYLTSKMKPAEASEAMTQADALLNGNANNKWVTMNAQNILLAIGAVIEDEGCESALDYLRMLAGNDVVQASGGNQHGVGQDGDLDMSRAGRGGGNAATSEDDNDM